MAGYGDIGSVNCQGGVLFLPESRLQKTSIAKTSARTTPSTFGVTIQAFQTPASPSYLTVTGTVNLGSCQFYGALSTNTTFQPGVGTQFMLIQNDGNDPINGTFAGLPEGVTFKFGGRQWQITYHGGTGNDVVLTLLTLQLPLRVDYSAINRTNKYVYVYGTGTPGMKNELHASTNLTTWIKVDDAVRSKRHLEATDNSWDYDVPNCFYRFFQRGTVSGPGPI